MFVVLFRAAVRARWQVQPFLYPEAAATAVGARLLEQFHGEALIAPVDVPAPGEVLKDLEE